MAITKAIRAVASGALMIIAATSLAACSSVSSVGDSSETATSREAGAYRASHLCVLNGTDKTIMSVGEYADMQRTGDTHPDPTGPLEPGATWCTNGYNSFKDYNGTVVDASVQITFANTENDYVRFLVNNPGDGYPDMWLGQDEWHRWFQPGANGEDWEIDVTYPNENTTSTSPKHDYHLRRLDDTTNFKEWLVTVRS
jgi:hypothetical protein